MAKGGSMDSFATGQLAATRPARDQGLGIGEERRGTNDAPSLAPESWTLDAESGFPDS